MKTEHIRYIVAAVPFVIFFAFMGNMFLNGVSTSAGAVMYQEKCANCHGKAGEGLKNLMPPVANADWVTNHYEELPCVMKYGLGGEIIVNGKTYNQPMMAVEPLTDIELLNITNYVLNELNDFDRYLTQQELEEMLRGCL
jgi:mono/diheme cytochrome c family protein